MDQSETQETATEELQEQREELQPEAQPYPNDLEICCTVHALQHGEILAPRPHAAANDELSTPWRVTSAQWKADRVVLMWERFTSAPLQVSMPLETTAAAVATEPAPTAELSPEDADLSLLGIDPARLMSGNVSPTAVPPPPVAMSRLPAYARHRDPLAPSQANVRLHGAAPTVPSTAPGYVPPPTFPIDGSGGLLGGLEVRQYSGPLPPIAPIVPTAPPAPAAHEPPPQRGNVTATVASSPSSGASAPGGIAAAPAVAPPRTSEPPATPMTAPLDAVIFPEQAAKATKVVKVAAPRAITPAPATAPVRR
jgi:hypothetical protein